MITENWNRLKKLLVIISPFKVTVVLILLLTVLASASETIGLTMVLPLLDAIIKGEISGKFAVVLNPLLYFLPGDNVIVKIVFLIFVLVGMKTTILICNTYLTSNFTWRLNERWNNALLNKYLFSSYEFFASQKHGKIVNNVLDQTAAAAQSLLRLNDFLSNVIVSFALYISLFLINWKLTVGLTLMGGCIYLFFSKPVKGYSSRLGHKKIKLIQRIFAETSECLSGFQLIKAYSLEKYRLGIFQKDNRLLRKLRVNFQVTNSLPNYLPEIIIVAIFIILLYSLSSFETDRVRAILPELAAVIVISQRFLSRIGYLVNQRMRIGFLLPSLSLVHDLLTTTIDREKAGGDVVFKSLEKDIVFKNVSFGYGGDKAVFSDITLTIPRGKMAAIVGPSGIGKSTLANLIMAFLQPKVGEILVNGLPLSRYDLNSWRSKIGYVSQDTVIFNASIRENIRVGDLKASDEEITRAAEKAVIHDFIMTLEDGYNTVVGDRGIKLSGGQKQRIAVARAILREPEIYLFDEATSALDRESERMIQDSIEQLSKEKTVVVIAHRLSTIERAHTVYDLSEMTQPSGTSEADKSASYEIVG